MSWMRSELPWQRCEGGVAPVAEALHEGRRAPFHRARQRAAEASGTRSEAGARQNVREHKQDAKEQGLQIRRYKLRKSAHEAFANAIGDFRELFPACWNIIPS
jgi:hypothetical protein